MNFRIEESNQTAVPFGIIGDFQSEILQQFSIKEKEVLDEGEQSIEPFGIPLNNLGNNWALMLENRFEFHAEYELDVNNQQYSIVLYKLLEEEKISFPFRGNNYALAFGTRTWLALVKQDRKIQLERGEVDALLVLYGSLGKNARKIRMIAKIISQLNLEGEVRHLKLTANSKERVMGNLIAEQTRIKFRIVRGAIHSTSITIDSSNHSDVTRPLESQGFRLEEERRDGYLHIGNNEVYSRITEGAGLHVRNKVDIGMSMGTLLGEIIPATRLDVIVKESTVEYEI
ncbi:MAG: hypothetical protein ACTSX1_01035, partial [Candidatus Heimdallarchaeaceae archaeon]